MSELEPSITKIMEAYKAAVDARDIDTFIGLYDPSARVFDAWGVWSYEGLPAWRVAIENWFASHAADRFKVSFEDVSAISSGEFASVTAIVTYAVVSQSGELLNSMQNRLSWLLKTSGPGLRIVHEHTSAPVGFEDGKAILQRKSKT